MIDYYVEQADINARLAARHAYGPEGQTHAALAQAYATVALVEATQGPMGGEAVVPEVCDICTNALPEVEDDGLYVCLPCAERLRRHEAQRLRREGK